MKMLEEIIKFLAPIICVYLVAILIYSSITLSKARIFAQETTFKSFETVHGFLKNLVVTSMLVVGFFYLVFSDHLGSLLPKNYELKISLKDESSKAIPDSILKKVRIFAKFDDTAYPLEYATDGDSAIFTAENKINRNLNTVLLFAEIDDPKYKRSERFIYFDRDSSMIKGKLVLEYKPGYMPKLTNAEVNNFLTGEDKSIIDSKIWYEGLWKKGTKAYWVFTLADSIKIVPLDSAKTYNKTAVEAGKIKGELELKTNQISFRGNLLNR